MKQSLAWLTWPRTVHFESASSAQNHFLFFSWALRVFAAGGRGFRPFSLHAVALSSASKAYPYRLVFMAEACRKERKSEKESCFYFENKSFRSTEATEAIKQDLLRAVAGQPVEKGDNSWTDSGKQGVDKA